MDNLCSFPTEVSSQTLLCVPNDTGRVSYDADLRSMLIQLICEQHHQALAVAYSILRDCADAEDELQNAYVKAWQHLGDYQGEGSFKAWFNRIVINQCLMRLRMRKKVLTIDQVVDYEETFQLELIDQRPLPEERLGECEVTRVVDREVRLLPPLLRKVVIMRDLDQMPIKDIADSIGISIAAVKSRLTRARAELKARVRKHLGVNGLGTLLRNPMRRAATYTRIS